MIRFRNLIIYFCIFAMFGLYSTSLSARYLMDPAKAIKEDVENIAQLPESAGKITKTVKNDVGDLTDSAVKGLTGDEGVNVQGGIVDDYNNKKKLRQAAESFAENDPVNSEILKNPEKYPGQKDKALAEFNQYASDKFGIENAKGVFSFNGEDSSLKGTDADKAMANGKEVNKSDLNGLYDKDNQTIGINEAKQDGSTEKLVKTDMHEFNHYLQESTGRAASLTDLQQEAGSNRLSNQAYNALSDEIGSGAPANQDHQDWVNNQDFSNGNAQAMEAKNIDPFLDPASLTIETSTAVGIATVGAYGTYLAIKNGQTIGPALQEGYLYAKDKAGTYLTKLNNYIGLNDSQSNGTTLPNTLQQVPTVLGTPSILQEPYVLTTPAVSLGPYVYSTPQAESISGIPGINPTVQSQPTVLLSNTTDDAPAKRDSTQVVLGKYPDYRDVSNDLGTRRFEVPIEQWEKMTTDEKWDANKKFLDRAILRGDEIILSNPVTKETYTGSYKQEIDYLLNHNYQLSNDGSKVIKK